MEVIQSGKRANFITDDKEWIHRSGWKWKETEQQSSWLWKNSSLPLIFEIQSRWDNVPFCEKSPSHPQSQIKYFVFLSDKDFTVKAVLIFKDPSMCVGFLLWIPLYKCVAHFCFTGLAAGCIMPPCLSSSWREQRHQRLQASTRSTFTTTAYPNRPQRGHVSLLMFRTGVVLYFSAVKAHLTLPPGNTTLTHITVYYI